MDEIVYGKNVVNNIIESNRLILQVYLVDGPQSQELIQKLKQKNIKYKIVSKKELDRFTNDNHQGVVARVGEYQYSSLDDIIKPIENQKRFVLILDGIEDPHNLGAIIRTADAAGVSGIIIPKHRSAKISNTVTKVSTGATEFVKTCVVTNLNEAIKFLKQQGFWIVGAEYDKKSVDYTSIDYNMDVALVIGSEGKGLSRLVKENCDFLVKIPMKGKVTSLNASVSAAILMYEIIKYQ